MKRIFTLTMLSIIITLSSNITMVKNFESENHAVENSETEINVHNIQNNMAELLGVAPESINVVIENTGNSNSIIEKVVSQSVYNESDSITEINIHDIKTNIAEILGTNPEYVTIILENKDTDGTIF